MPSPDETPNQRHDRYMANMFAVVGLMLACVTAFFLLIGSGWAMLPGMLCLGCFSAAVTLRKSL